MTRKQEGIANLVTQRPLLSIPVAEDALTQWMKANRPNKQDQLNTKQGNPRLFINVEGALGQNSVTPRGLCSRVLHQLVRVTGIVTKATLVRPRIEKSRHWCETTSLGHEREQPDQMRISKSTGTGSLAFPTKDNQGNALSCDFGLCHQSDFQTVVVQELPEGAPPGCLPRSCTVVLSRDLVDTAMPGSRVQVTGVWRAVGGIQAATKGGAFKAVLIATGVATLADSTPTLAAEDISAIRRESELPDVVDRLAASLAPALAGHTLIKKALILQLLGGGAKNLESGIRLRGDINIMLTGDPACAKSQLLRSVLQIAPLAVTTTGKGSSGVGLTAAVVFSSDSRERMLEAGAMVLADGGVVCIDEFDKMEEEDKVALHEAMEQQTVTVAKAGLHVTLNARCSVLASANPLYGTWQRNVPIKKNLAMPDSLLSRFDLLFVCLDNRSREKDDLVSKRVLANHSFKTEDDTQQSDFGELQDKHKAWIVEYSQREETGVSECQTDAYQQGTNTEQQVYTKPFLKKQLAFAKNKGEPTLRQDTCDQITGLQAGFREDENKHKGRCLPVTVRTLESIIRLATAHAKARLSDVVEILDVEAVTELVEESVFCRALTKVHMDEENDEDIDEVDNQLNNLVMRETQMRETRSNMTSPIISQKRNSRLNEKNLSSTSQVKNNTGKNKKKPKRDEVADEMQQVKAMFAKNLQNEEELKQMKKKLLELVGEMQDSGRQGEEIDASDILELLKERALKLAEQRCLAPISDISAVFTILKELEADNKVFITSDDKIMIVD